MENQQEHQRQLQNSHQEALQKLDDYIQSTKASPDHEKVHALKEEWSVAWAKLMEALLTLERIEI